MVLACVITFSRTSLFSRPHILKSTPVICNAYLPSGASNIVFTCPSAIIFKFYLPGATGQAQMSSPVNRFPNVPVIKHIHNDFNLWVFTDQTLSVNSENSAMLQISKIMTLTGQPDACPVWARQ